MTLGNACRPSAGALSPTYDPGLWNGPSVQPLTLAGIALVLAPTAWMMAGRAAAPAPQLSFKSQPPR